MTSTEQNPIQRTQCPFYGFAGMAGIFMDQKGNQCPLKGGYAPCHMKMRGDSPDWKACEYHEQTSLDRFAEITIFPDEFHPVGARTWKGMKFRTWAEYILEKKQPPIEVSAEEKK